jgi:hypothetical protein
VQVLSAVCGILPQGMLTVLLSREGRLLLPFLFRHAHQPPVCDLILLILSAAAAQKQDELCDALRAGKVHKILTAGLCDAGSPESVCDSAAYLVLKYLTSVSEGSCSLALFSDAVEAEGLLHRCCRVVCNVPVVAPRWQRLQCSRVALSMMQLCTLQKVSISDPKASKALIGKGPTEWNHNPLFGLRKLLTRGVQGLLPTLCQTLLSADEAIPALLWLVDGVGEEESGDGEDGEDGDDSVGADHDAEGAGNKSDKGKVGVDVSDVLLEPDATAANVSSATSDDAVVDTGLSTIAATTTTTTTTTGAITTGIATTTTATITTTTATATTSTELICTSNTIATESPASGTLLPFTTTTTTTTTTTATTTTITARQPFKQPFTRVRLGLLELLVGACSASPALITLIPRPTWQQLIGWVFEYSHHNFLLTHFLHLFEVLLQITMAPPADVEPEAQVDGKPPTSKKKNKKKKKKRRSQDPADAAGLQVAGVRPEMQQAQTEAARSLLSYVLLECSLVTRLIDFYYQKKRCSLHGFVIVLLNPVRVASEEEDGHAGMLTTLLRQVPLWTQFTGKLREQSRIQSRTHDRESKSRRGSSNRRSSSGPGPDAHTMTGKKNRRTSS